MKWVRNLLLAVFSLAFLAVLACWMVYVPANQESIYEAMPANADFVSAHLDLAGRMDDMLDNSLFLSALTATGLSRKEIVEIVADPEFRDWAEKIASDEIVLARVPSDVFPDSHAWCMAAWIGSKSVKLRWMLEMYAREYRQGSIAGTSIWCFDMPDMPNNYKLYCAIEEGVVLAALSDSSTTFRNLILTSQGRSPSFADVRPDWTPPTRRSYKQNSDQCRLLNPFSNGDQLAKLNFRSVKKQNIEGSIVLSTDRKQEEKSDGALLDRPEPLAWENAIGQTLISSQGAQSLARSLSNQPAFALALQISSEIQDGKLFMACLDGEFRGRFKGFRIPGLLLAMPVEDNAEALHVIFSKLDRINAMYSLGLIYRKVDIADTEIFFIEGTKENLYGSLPPEEQISFTIKNGLFVVASHPGIIQRIALDQTGISWESPIWQNLTSNDDTSFIWFDLNKSVKALRLALAVYSLKLITENPGKSREIREDIEAFKGWLDLLADYRETTVWTEDDGVFHFKMGTAPAR